MKNKLNERTFISKNWILYFFLFLGFSCQSNQSLYKDRPNIILLLADDLGYNELGSYGQKIIRTPYLDSLAKEGMIFKNFYAGKRYRISYFNQKRLK